MNFKSLGPLGYTQRHQTRMWESLEAQKGDTIVTTSITDRKKSQ